MTKTIAVMLVSLMFVSFASMPVLAASETKGVSVQSDEKLSDYDTADVAAINAMIQSNASLSALYNVDEPWNWGFVGWNGFTKYVSAIDLSTKTTPGLGGNTLPANISGKVTIANLPRLNYLLVMGTNISELVLSNLPDLVGFHCIDNAQQAVLNMQGVPALVSIYSSGTPLAQWNANQVPSLTSIRTYDTKFKDLDLSGLKKLVTAIVQDNSVTLANNHRAHFDTVNFKGCNALNWVELGASSGKGIGIVSRFTNEDGKTMIFQKPKTGDLSIYYVPKKSGDPNLKGCLQVFAYGSDGKRFSPVKKWSFSPAATIMQYSDAFSHYIVLKPKAGTTTVSATLKSDATTKVTKVNFPQASVRTMVNKSLTIPAVAYTSNNKTAKVTYSSSKPEVATVNANGKIVAKSPGTTTITAKSGSKKDTLKVTVLAPGAKSVKVKKVTAKIVSSMTVGQAKYITPTTSSASATNVTVTLSLIHI